MNQLPSYLYRLVLSGRCYINHNGLLMYHYGNQRCIVIPNSLKRSVLSWAHDQTHHGGQKTFEKVVTQGHFWWSGFRTDIQKYVNTCHPCQQVKGGKAYPHKAGRIKTFSANEPFELISIDICGPLPQTTRGNRHIINSLIIFKILYTSTHC